MVDVRNFELVDLVLDSDFGFDFEVTLEEDFVFPVLSLIADCPISNEFTGYWRRLDRASASGIVVLKREASRHFEGVLAGRFAFVFGRCFS